MSSTRQRSTALGSLALAAVLACSGCSIVGFGDDGGGEFGERDGRTAVDALVPMSAAADSFATPTAGDTPAQHFEAMVTDLVDATTGDRRIVDAEMVDLFNWRIEQHLPDLVINTFSASASVRAETFDIVAAYMETGAEAGYDDETTAWFQERAEPARALSEQFLEALDVVEDAHELHLPGRLCFAMADSSERECEGQTEAVDLLDRLDELGDADIELPDDFSANRNPVDGCDAWTNAVADEPEDAVVLLERWLELNRLDSRFIGRSECRLVELGDEDIAIDTRAGIDAFTAVYSTLADVEPEEWAEPDSFEIIMSDPGKLEYLRAGSAAAREQFDEVTEPNARLAMIVIALRAEREVVARELMEGVARDEYVEVFECADPDGLGADWMAGCDGDEQTIVEYGWLHDPGTVFFVSDYADWGSIEEVTGYCEAWDDQLGSLDDDRSRPIYALRGAFGGDEC